MLWRIVALVLSTQCSPISGAVLPLMQAPQFAPGAIIVPLGVQNPYGILGNPAGFGNPMMPRDVAVHSHRHVYMVPRETAEDRARKQAQEEILRRNEERLKVAEAETSRLKSDLEELKQAKQQLVDAETSRLRSELEELRQAKLQHQSLRGSRESEDDEEAENMTKSSQAPIPGLSEEELDHLTTDRIRDFDDRVRVDPFATFPKMDEIRLKVVESLESIREVLKRNPNLRDSIGEKIDKLFAQVIEHMLEAIEKAKKPPTAKVDDHRVEEEDKKREELNPPDAAKVIAPPFQGGDTGGKSLGAGADIPGDVRVEQNLNVPPVVQARAAMAEAPLELDVLESVRVVFDNWLQSVQRTN